MVVTQDTCEELVVAVISTSPTTPLLMRSERAAGSDVVSSSELPVAPDTFDSPPV